MCRGAFLCTDLCLTKHTHTRLLTDASVRTLTHTHTHTVKDAEGAVGRANLRLHVTVISPRKRNTEEEITGGISATAMAFSTVRNYCVPLTIITVAYFVRTGKPPTTVCECDVIEKSIKPWWCRFIPVQVCPSLLGRRS